MAMPDTMRSYVFSKCNSRACESGAAGLNKVAFFWAAKY